MQIRQGDILLEKIAELPKEVKEKDGTIAYGEVTGHSHRIEGAGVMIDAQGRQFVVAKQEAMLLHEEHAQQTIPVGIFAVIRQREYDIVQGVRQVMD